MALKQQALSGFKRMPDDRIAVAVSTVIQAMTGNGNFPDPVPTVEVIQTALDDYSSKLAAIGAIVSYLVTLLQRWRK